MQPQPDESKPGRRLKQSENVTEREKIRNQKEQNKRRPTKNPKENKKSENKELQEDFLFPLLPPNKAILSLSSSELSFSKKRWMQGKGKTEKTVVAAAAAAAAAHRHYRRSPRWEPVRGRTRGERTRSCLTPWSSTTQSRLKSMDFSRRFHPDHLLDHPPFFHPRPPPQVPPVSRLSLCFFNRRKTRGGDSLLVV